MNCVLTTASENITIGLERFLKSFRTYNKIDDIVIFVKQPSTNINILKSLKHKYNAKIIIFNSGFCDNMADLMSKRFLMYEEYLKTNQYEKILHIDYNDVLFQSNIFDYTFDTDLIFFEEKSLIKNEIMNLSWIKQFNANIVDSITNNYVLCMGSILGTQSGILSFISQFKDIMFNGKNIPLNLDQAVLNIMVYYQKLPNLKFKTVSNEEGPIGTIGLSAALKKLNSSGYIVDENDRVIPVVHQFNRMSPNQIKLVCTALDVPYNDLISNES